MSTIPLILSTSSSQQVDLSDDGGSGNPQSPVGSPPLILAFLAIGVFSVAMIAVFGWRRIQLQLGRETSLWGHPQQRRSTRGIDSAGLADLKFREKPVLWEVQVEHDKEGEEHGSWDNILPLAVLPVPHDDRSSHISTSESCPPQRPSRFNESLEPRSIFPLPRVADSRSWRGLSEVGPMSIFRRRPHSNTTSNARSDSVCQEYSIQEAPKDAQVIMIVKMPSPTKSRYHRAHSSGHATRSSHYSFLSNSETLAENMSRIQDLSGIHRDSWQFQYSIGVHTCPWPPSTNFPARNNDVGRIPHSRAEKELG